MKRFYEEKFANPDGGIKPETGTIKPAGPPEEQDDLPE